MTRYRRTTIIAAAATLGVVAAATAATAPAWHTGVPVAASPTLTAGAVSARGDAVAVGSVGVGTANRIEVAQRTGLTGAWRTSLLGTPSGGASTATAGINDAGVAVVAWRVMGGKIDAAYRPNPTGAWRISAVPYGWPARWPSDFTSATAKVAVNGSVALTWLARENTGWAVRSAFKSGPAAAWRATPGFVIPAPAGTRVLGASVVANAAGDAAAIWRLAPANSPAGTVYVAVRAGRGAWRAPVALAGASSSTPVVGISTNGRVVAAWSTRHTVNGVSVYDARLTKTVVHSGVWTTPVWLTTGTVAAVAINAHGALSALITEPRAVPLTYTVSAAVSPDGQTWTPQTILSRSGLTQPAATMSDQGQAAVAFVARTPATGAKNVRLAASGLTGQWTGATVPGQTTVGLSADQAHGALALTGSVRGTLASSWDPPVGGK